MNSPRLERLTRTHPAAPLVLFVPVLAVLLWRQVLHHHGPGVLLVLLIGGLFLWTLTEYGIHRFFFHLRPRGRLSVVLAYLVHGVHHAFPSDGGRLVMPPVVSIPLAVAFYLLFVAAAGVAVGEGLCVGFLAGYVAYDTLHWTIHATGARGRWLSALRRNHMQHHFRVPDRRFGVSTTVWDRVFRTR